MKSWSLLEFAALKGKMKVGSFENSETHESFKSCIFIDAQDNKCFVGFAQKLGELTPAQISAQKAELQVVENEEGRYYLCKVGNNAWEDVEL